MKEERREEGDREMEKVKKGWKKKGRKEMKEEKKRR